MYEERKGDLWKSSWISPISPVKIFGQLSCSDVPCTYHRKNFLVVSGRRSSKFMIRILKYLIVGEYYIKNIPFVHSSPPLHIYVPALFLISKREIR
jgi:hypothetical protein